MKVLFLAGGQSVRMWPLSFDKNLISFCGQTLVAHTLSTARKAGLSEFVLVGNEENKKRLEQILKRTDVKGTVVVQKKSGQGGAILSAKGQIRNQDVLVVNANDVFEDDLYRKILIKAKDRKNDAILVGYKTKSYFPGGYLKVKDDKVLAVIEKPAENKVPSNLVRLVCDYFSDANKLLEFLAKVKTDRDDLYEQVMDKMISEGIRFSFVSYDGFWKSIKYPWHILDLTEYFLAKIKPFVSKKTEISRKATLDGPVVIEDGVRIFENAVVKGPCWIGRNSIIGSGALVRQSIISQDCVVGYNTEITRSYVGPSCWFHTNYIGDSILDENVSFGSGAITANLRLDEGEIYSLIKGSKINTQRNKFGNIIGKNVRVGINAMLMPGVKIGANSFVGSGAILFQDLEENKFCIVSQEHQITKNRLGIATKDREEFRKRLS